jgi:hypothetical protein
VAKKAFPGMVSTHGYDVKYLVNRDSTEHEANVCFGVLGQARLSVSESRGRKALIGRNRNLITEQIHSASQLQLAFEAQHVLCIIRPRYCDHAPYSISTKLCGLKLS